MPENSENYYNFRSSGSPNFLFSPTNGPNVSNIQWYETQRSKSLHLCLINDSKYSEPNDYFHDWLIVWSMKCQNIVQDQKILGFISWKTEKNIKSSHFRSRSKVYFGIFAWNKSLIDYQNDWQWISDDRLVLSSTSINHLSKLLAINLLLIN